MSNVSLYIPAYNVQSHIARCLDGALSQSHAIDEVLVIDDGSQDETAEIVRDYASRYDVVRLVQHGGNKGLGAVRNTGVNRSRNELVASLDADTCPDPDWLERLLKHFVDPQIVVTGGMLIESAIQSSADRFRQAYMSQHWGKQTRRNPSFMFGNNTVVRRSVIQGLGGFDSSMTTNGEDVDISRKIRQENYDTLYDPSAIVHHHRTDTVASILDTHWRWFAFATRTNVLPPRIRRTLANATSFFGVSAWRSATNPRYWLDPPVFALNVALPFYMTYRQLRHDFQDSRRDADVRFKTA